MGLGIQKKLLVAVIPPAEAPRIFHALQVCPAPAPAQEPLKRGPSFPPYSSLRCLGQTGRQHLFFKHVHCISRGWL